MTIAIQMIGLGCFGIGFAGLITIGLIAWTEDRACRISQQQPGSASR